MKVFAECGLEDNAISRVAKAVAENTPPSVQLVSSEDEADLVIIYAYAHRRSNKYRSEHLLDRGKKYAIIQFSVRSTPNPLTADWLSIWERAELVWSYYDLEAMCKEDGNVTNFNFYRAPLGVDTKIFCETPSARRFVVAGTGTGRGWNKECKNEIVKAAGMIGKPVFQLGFGENTENITYSNGMDDATLAKHYSQCEFVSGLRRIEGFELPVLEGLMCGARPIVFDKPHYRDWFEDLAEFIPEDDQRVENLLKIFLKGAKPVTEKEKEYVRKNFDWAKICKEFWRRLSK